MTATGLYINEFDEWYDVYVILNEPNSRPTPSEVNEISEVIKYHVSEAYDSIETLENAIRMHLENMDISCLDYGFHVVALRYNPQIFLKNIMNMYSEALKSKEGSFSK